MARQLEDKVFAPKETSKGQSWSSGSADTGRLETSAKGCILAAEKFQSEAGEVGHKNNYAPSEQRQLMFSGLRIFLALRVEIVELPADKGSARPKVRKEICGSRSEIRIFKDNPK